MGLECIAKMQPGGPRHLSRASRVAMGLECIAKMQRYGPELSKMNLCRNGFRVHREDATRRSGLDHGRRPRRNGFRVHSEDATLGNLADRRSSLVAMGLECIAKMQPNTSAGATPGAVSQWV